MEKILSVIFFMHVFCASAATHIVTNTHDSGSGSFRQAILDANADMSPPRIINFAINSGLQVIQPRSALLALTASHIFIDGSSQPGWSPDHPMIVLDGYASDFGFNGITLDTAYSCTIQDLIINHGFAHGISIVNSSDDNEIYACFLGTDATGTYTAANSWGIAMSAFDNHEINNTIIGTPTKGNLISGNTYAGIFLSGNINNTVIQSNKIGTDRAGQKALPNMRAGIAIGAMPMSSSVSCNQVHIGGALVAEGNIIGFNITGTFAIPNTLANILMIQSVVPVISNILIQNNIS